MLAEPVLECTVDADASLTFTWRLRTSVATRDDPPATFLLHGAFVNGTPGETRFPGQPPRNWSLRNAIPLCAFTIDMPFQHATLSFGISRHSQTARPGSRSGSGCQARTPRRTSRRSRRDSDRRCERACCGSEIQSRLQPARPLSVEVHRRPNSRPCRELTVVADDDTGGTHRDSTGPWGPATAPWRIRRTLRS